MESYLHSVEHFITMSPEMATYILVLAKVVGAIIFLPGTPLTLLTGATLGVWSGFLVSIIGNTLGAMAAFLIARYILRDWVQRTFFVKYPRLRDYEERFIQNGFMTVVLLRLIPLFPFNALNYALGVTKVSIRDYFLGTLVGILPGTFVFVYFGDALRMVSLYQIIVSVIAIIGLILIGNYYEKRTQKRK